MLALVPAYKTNMTTLIRASPAEGADWSAPFNLARKEKKQKRARFMLGLITFFCLFVSMIKYLTEKKKHVCVYMCLGVLAHVCTHGGQRSTQGLPLIIHHLSFSDRTFH